MHSSCKHEEWVNAAQGMSVKMPITLYEAARTKEVCKHCGAVRPASTGDSPPDEPSAAERVKIMRQLDTD